MPLSVASDTSELSRLCMYGHSVPHVLLFLCASAGVAEKETDWIRREKGSRDLAEALLYHLSLSHT